MRRRGAGLAAASPRIKIFEYGEPSARKLKERWICRPVFTKL